jgi:hypothetical protein
MMNTIVIIFDLLFQLGIRIHLRAIFLLLQFHNFAQSFMLPLNLL